jgi:hypothetical protein
MYQLRLVLAKVELLGSENRTIAFGGKYLFIIKTKLLCHEINVHTITFIELQFH